MMMDECAARLHPLVDQYKPTQHQILAIEKFPRFDRNNLIMSWGQKNLFKKMFAIGENMKYRVT